MQYQSTEPELVAAYVVASGLCGLITLGAILCLTL